MNCLHGIWMGACQVCKPIHSAKDQQWRFTYPFKPNDQVEIHSKGQFVRECKKRGRVWTGVEDLVSRGTPYHASQKPIDISKIAPVLSEVYKESRDTGRVERKWNQLKSAGKV